MDGSHDMEPVGPFKGARICNEYRWLLAGALKYMIDHANKSGFIHSKGVFEMHVAATPDELIDLIDDKKQAPG